MQFYIPPELQQVECHLNWMGDVIPDLEKTVLDRCETMEEHIRFLLENRLDYYGEADGNVEAITDDMYEENYNDHNPMYVNIFASRLNQAAHLSYLSYFEEAKEKLDILDKVFCRLDSSHREGCKYAVDAMKWSIKVLENYKRMETPSTSKNKVVLEAVEDVTVFQRKWEKVQKNCKSKAVIKYLWTTLAAGMKITENYVVATLQDLLILDPDYHVWYSVIYRSMRGMRRNMMRAQSGGLSSPSEEEQRMCREAYKRRPKIYMCIKDMAIMLKEMLWVFDHAAWDRHEDAYLQCQSLFEEALHIANELNQRNWIKKMQVYYGEFLIFGKGKKLDQEKGKYLFDVCVEENPEDTTVLHKAGKICHYGAATKRNSTVKKYRDWKIAEQFYQCALVARPVNFPCLKDYLKLLATQKKYADYITLCKDVIDDMQRDYQVSDLKIACGCILWIFNPFRSGNHKIEACENWLYVIAKLPDFADNIYPQLKKPLFNWDRKKPGYIKPREILITLDRMRKIYSDDSDDDKRIVNAIDIFSQKLAQTPIASSQASTTTSNTPTASSSK